MTTTNNSENPKPIGIKAVVAATMYAPKSQSKGKPATVTPPKPPAQAEKRK